MSNNFPVLVPDLQVSFYYRLKNIKDLYFHNSLKNTIKELSVKEVDEQLSQYVTNKSLQKLAQFSLRGESFFPVPIILMKNPLLLGYYRLLYGFSQKTFYSSNAFGSFKNMEEKGKLTNKTDGDLVGLCKCLVQTAESLVNEMDEFTISTITELQLLTVGPQLRGSKNNEYGQVAAQKTFNLIKALVKEYIVTATSTSIEISNDSGRLVNISFSADPDIEITEQMSGGRRGLVSIEIKGGRDISNIHNRIGEAEKSHQKAKKRGYFEFITILSVDIDYKVLGEESPTTSHFFNLDKLMDESSIEYSKFKDLISSIVSIHLD